MNTGRDGLELGGGWGGIWGRQRPERSDDSTRVGVRVIGDSRMQSQPLAPTGGRVQIGGQMVTGLGCGNPDALRFEEGKRHIYKSESVGPVGPIEPALPIRPRMSAWR
jgi:hypothetical protein